MNLADIDKTPDDLWWISELYSKSSTSQNKFARNHGLRAGSLCRWMKKYNKSIKEKMAPPGVFALNPASGRPFLVDSIGLEILRTDLTTAEVKPSRSDFKEMVLGHVRQSMERKGVKMAATMGKSTLKRLKAKLGATNNKGQAKTKARLRAEGDPRNYITMAAML